MCQIYTFVSEEKINDILFYSILFYSILFYSILFYSILLYSILFYSIIFYSIHLAPAVAVQGLALLAHPLVQLAGLLEELALEEGGGHPAHQLVVGQKAVVLLEQA